jgi:hypothetical protein
MNRGMGRSKNWQQNYLITCLVQLVVEVVLYQTVECLWIHLAVPRLIVAEVDAAMVTIHQCINAAFKNEKREIILNTPAHFFASRDVAEFFPNLFEASVVLAFQSFHPPSRLDLLAQERDVNCCSDGFVSALLFRWKASAAVVALMKYSGMSVVSYSLWC